MDGVPDVAGSLRPVLCYHRYVRVLKVVIDMLRGNAIGIGRMWRQRSPCYTWNSMLEHTTQSHPHVFHPLFFFFSLNRSWTWTAKDLPSWRKLSKQCTPVATVRTFVWICEWIWEETRKETGRRPPLERNKSNFGIFKSFAVAGFSSLRAARLAGCQIVVRSPFRLVVNPKN